MQPDSMLTTHQMIHESKKDVRRRFHDHWTAFVKAEPELGQFIANESVRICGKLGLSGAPQEVLRGVLDDMRRLTLTSLMAVRRWQYELWKDTQMGARLADLWQSDEPTGHEDGSDTAPPLKADWRDDGP